MGLQIFMKVRDVMVSDVTTISPDTTYEEAARIMNDRSYSGMPVVDASGRMVGIVSEKDLLKGLFPRYRDYAMDPEGYRDQEVQEREIAAVRNRPVKEFMVPQVVTVRPDDPILRAGGLMLAYEVHRLPVVDERSGKLQGIVTRRDIFGAILRQYLGF